MKNTIILFYIGFLLVISMQAQEFHCVLSFPNKIDQNIQLEIDAGNGFYTLDFEIKEDVIILKGESKVPLVKVFIKFDDGFEKTILIESSKESIIAIDENRNLELFNAFDGYDSVKISYHNSITQSERALVEWMVKNSELIQQNRDSANIIIKSKNDKLNNDRIRFIMKNKNNFFSYEVFKKYILGSPNIETEEKLKLFHSFPPEFRSGPDSNEVKNKLNI